MTISTDRQQFRETVALVAAKAKEKLPQSINGRLESAVKLVLGHDVMPQADGSILVGSSSDAMKTYLLQGIECECRDCAQAPEHWCKHRISAGIHKRVQALLPQAPESGPEVHPVCTSALPEAPASVNVRLTIAGRECQLTLRGADEWAVLARLEEVLQRYPQPQAQPLSPQQHNAMAQHRAVAGWCKVHNVEMKLNQGKDGRTWYSHFDEAAGRWCKGK